MIHHVPSGRNYNLVLTKAQHNAVQYILASAFRKQDNSLPSTVVSFELSFDRTYLYID